MHKKDGFQGMTIVVKDTLSSYEVKRESQLYIYVKINGLPGINHPIHVVAIYLPSGGNFRRERRKRIRKLLDLNREILHDAPGAPIVFLGDWNLDTEELTPELHSELSGLHIHRAMGSALSRFPLNTSARALDHLVVSQGMVRYLRRPRVHRNYGISDHRPVIAPFRTVIQNEPPPVRQWRVDTDAIKRSGRDLVWSNRWELLDPDVVTDPEGLTAFTDAFINTMDSVSRRLGIKKLKVSAKPRMPRKLVSLMKRRNEAADKLTKAVLRGDNPSQAVRDRLVLTQRAYRQGRHAWAIRQNGKEISDTCRDLRGNDYKKVWARIQTKVGHDIGGSALPPIRDKDGALQVTTDGILEAIADHYDRLANSDPGPSQDAEHWANMDLGEDKEELEALNEDISWPEILLSIRRMNRNTAVNARDQIHINVMKELLNEECRAEVHRQYPNKRPLDNVRYALGEEELPKAPITPLGKSFFAILKLTWEQGQAPDMWNEVYICNLYKSGNPELMVNYRGISLISVGFKILLGILADRMYAAMKKLDYLVPEQAGFRRHEEAVAQYIAIAEIVRRRHLVNKSTYGIFIDFKKAFDKVHHEGLYRVLDHMGIRGRTLALIKSMYRNSRMSIVAGGRTTRFFGMKRGNRQGCPLSPLLFIIFVNYLLRDSTAGGVTVPGVDQRCQGGLYADDVVALEETSEKAQEFCKRIYDWGQKWGMELGLPKCGVMLFSTSDEEHQHHNAQTYSCADGDLPIVQMYKYLGIEMEPTLPNDRNADGNEASFVKRQAAKGDKVLNTLRPLLRDPTWPLPVKASIIRTLLMPIMTYGSEWVGYKKLNAAPIQRVVNKALKLAMGNSTKSNAHETLTLSYELGLPLIEEEQNALRARLSAKLQFTPKFSTWIKTLHANPYRALRKTWVTTNERWEKQTLKGKAKHSGQTLRLWVNKGHTYETHTRCNDYRNAALDNVRDARTGVDLLGFETTDPPANVIRHLWGYAPVAYDETDERAVRNMATIDYQSKSPQEWEFITDIRACVLERIMETNRTEAFRFYDALSLGATRGYLRASLTQPDLAPGVIWLVRIRTRAFPRVLDRWQKITRSGKQPPFQRNHCPLCGDRVEHGWEWEHLLVSCDNIFVETKRRAHLAPIIALLTHELQTCEGVDHTDFENIFDDRTTGVPLLRAIAIYMIGGVVNEFFDASYHIGFGQTDELPHGLPSYGYTFVAKFLQEVVPAYVEKLFPEGDPHYGNRGDYETLYTPGSGSAHSPLSLWSQSPSSPLA
ncbi:hypothetical protein EWM64_g2557 [Hericium alpestre]|uniref:Reverse transcriptase domain-containing protein n=1 Tax=Hericium alpestre TaxID=135208 RepID=A0A4Z0A355_9AGAM|nr:hypothetical protein EWM64_g2557 [Hericium alpestre]